MDAMKTGTDTLFILLGAIMVLAMHAGFAFLELGTVRYKNQVNALVKILVDFAVSTLSYFLLGYLVAYGTSFLVGADTLVQKNGYELVKFFFLLTFAAAIPAIVSGGHCGACPLWPAADRHRPPGRPGLPALRGHDMERALRVPGLDQGHLWRKLSRLRGLGRRACPPPGLGALFPGNPQAVIPPSLCPFPFDP